MPVAVDPRSWKAYKMNSFQLNTGGFLWRSIWLINFVKSTLERSFSSLFDFLVSTPSSKYRNIGPFITTTDFCRSSKSLLLRGIGAENYNPVATLSHRDMFASAAYGLGLIRAVSILHEHAFFAKPPLLKAELGFLFREVGPWMVWIVHIIQGKPSKPLSTKCFNKHHQSFSRFGRWYRSRQLSRISFFLQGFLLITLVNALPLLSPRLMYASTLFCDLKTHVCCRETEFKTTYLQTPTTVFLAQSNPT
jgi:hypothetical protein